MHKLDEARMARHTAYLEKKLPLAEQVWEAFQDNLNNGESAQVLDTKHKDKRSFERAVSRSHILSVLKNGYVIDIQGHSSNSFDMLIMSYVKLSKGYRPLHVAITLTEDICTVKTVYDPRSKHEQWDDNLETRLFFIKEEEKVC